jgi:hypothetical protein
METTKMLHTFRNLSLTWDIEKILNYDTIHVSTDTVGNYKPSSFEIAGDLNKFEGEASILFTLEVNDTTYFYESKRERDQDNAKLLEVISKYKP